MANLNQDCLEHIFRFLEAKDWLSFSQVCKSWKLAANSTEFHKLTYTRLGSKALKAVEVENFRLTFAGVRAILQFVAPNLKYITIQGLGNESSYEEDVYIVFGDSTYFVTVNKTQQEILLDILATQTKDVETFETISFGKATARQWEIFFQVNPVTCFEFTADFAEDRESFFTNYISILPNNLIQVSITFGVCDSNKKWNDSEGEKLMQFLAKQQQLSKLSLVYGSYFPPNIARELEKHIKNIEELCLTQEPSDDDELTVKDDSAIPSVIPKCTNLKALRLSGFTLTEDLCRNIARNCRYIRNLCLDNTRASEECVRELISLPDLTTLEVDSVKITLTEPVEKLRRLGVNNHFVQNIDYDNLARALTFMPSLCSLVLAVDSEPMTETAARTIKKTIHSRGQNIGLYSAVYVQKIDNWILRKKAEVPCQAPTLRDEFEIVYTNKFKTVKMLTKV